MKHHNLLSKRRVNLLPIRSLDSERGRKNRIKTCISERVAEFVYHLYAPTSRMEGLPVLVAVHGISHRAKEQARAFSQYAQRYGCVVIAPLFNRKNFPAYQRLGVSQQPVAQYPDCALNTLLDEVGEHTGAATDQVYLFGYSAGGQFVHRYAMVYPDRVHAVTSGAAGWYTFPDRQAPFPRGLRRRSGFRPLKMNPEAFLQIPMATFVGEKDIQQDSTFKRSSRLDLQQGLTRIERAERWIDAMREAAQVYGLDTHYESHVMPSCGHCFVDCLEHGQLAFKAMDFLFETTGHPGVVGQAMPSLSKQPENDQTALS